MLELYFLSLITVKIVYIYGVKKFSPELLNFRANLKYMAIKLAQVVISEPGYGV
jgi:hypothetical protein